MRVWHWRAAPQVFPPIELTSSGSVKICRPPIVDVTTVNAIIGRSEGTLMWRNCFQPPAPSAAAASYSSRGTAWSEARYSRVLYPVHRHATMTAISKWLPRTDAVKSKW